MASNSVRFDLVDDVENDSGVFSDVTTSAQLPAYFNGPDQNRSVNRERKKSLQRVIRKTGKPNIFRKIPNLWAAYIRDIGNTLVNCRWTWTLICFASSYILTWLIFAACYMLIAQDNNDISKDNPSKAPCLMGIQGFAGYFLFSLETQHTIGYGSRYITSNCNEGTFLISLQMIFGISLCGVMTSIVYTKMVRPHNVPTTALFSKVCVVCQRDGELCLIFRLRDKKNLHRVNTKVNLYLVHRRNEAPYLKSLKLEPPGILLWPLEIVHKITPTSPFWDLSAKDVITKRFELLVTVHGSSLTTAQSSMTRASYVSKEILWGHRFIPCIKYDYERHGYYIDSTNFQATEEILTPLCSAKRLCEVSEEISLAVSSLRSPTLSRTCDSSRSSSGFASYFDEPVHDNNIETLTTPVVLRKLSTIREFNSLENLTEDEFNASKLSLRSINNEKDSQSDERGIFSIEELIAKMQSYSSNIEMNDSKGSLSESV
uniref:Inward rectifier potassium channel C-terminal domain-containing protein n=1 Tax=Photinus pyralis TaxID=7054 RepID=A0A1Y1NKS0_PHOPY